MNDLSVTFALTPMNRCGTGTKLEENSQPEKGSIPRLSRLMALAIRFNELLRRGEIKDYADLARLGYVTRARITQIMNLLNLAPDIQEQILFLPHTTKGRDPINERDIRPIAAIPQWNIQRAIWEKIKANEQDNI